jgi:NADH-quinone oxidoreductase subunit A
MSYLSVSDYYYIVIFFLIATLFSLIFFFVSVGLVSRSFDNEKLSGYECGFDSFDADAQSKFDVKFYLVGILFILFDLEIIFFFPWVCALRWINWYGYVSMLVFLFFLIAGFIFEWKKGVLDWSTAVSASSNSVTVEEQELLVDYYDQNVLVYWLQNVFGYTVHVVIRKESEDTYKKIEIKRKFKKTFHG